MAGSLVDEVIEALQSHPDPHWAKVEAQRVIDEYIGDRDECGMCAGYGYVSEPDEPVELLDAELNALEDAHAYLAKAKASAAKDRVQALVSIITRILEEHS